MTIWCYVYCYRDHGILTTKDSKMSKTIYMANSIITLSESKAVCPECERNIPFEEIEYKWMKQDNHTIKIKCKCKRLIGITQDMRGDFVAFSLKKSNSKLLK